MLRVDKLYHPRNAVENSGQILSQQDKQDKQDEQDEQDSKPSRQPLRVGVVGVVLRPAATVAATVRPFPPAIVSKQASCLLVMRLSPAACIYVYLYIMQCIL